MRVKLAVPLALALLPAALSADVYVRSQNDRLTIRVHREPLARVLAGIARETGIAVVYNSPAPSQLVSLSLENVTPQEALIRLFDGQGLNYIFQVDPTGKKVAMLIVAGTASAANRPTPANARPVPAPMYNEEEVAMEDEPESDEEVVEQPGMEEGVHVEPAPDTNISNSVWNPGAIVMPSPPAGAFPGVNPYPGQPGASPNFPGGASQPAVQAPQFPRGQSQPQP